MRPADMFLDNVLICTLYYNINTPVKTQLLAIEQGEPYLVLPILRTESTHIDYAALSL